MPSTIKTAHSKSEGLLFPDYLPHYDPLEKVQPFGSSEHVDPGHCADPSKPSLSKATKVTGLSPHSGTEILGVDLTALSSALDELAHLTAEHGCVVFRDQDTFLNSGFEAQKKVASHFRLLDVHGWMPHPANGPAEFVIVYDSKDDLRVRKSWARKNPIQFHIDQ